MPPYGSHCERLRIEGLMNTVCFYHEHEIVLDLSFIRLTIASLLTYVGDVASHCKVVLKPSVKNNGLHRWSNNGICFNPTNPIIVLVKLVCVSVQLFWFPNKHFFLWLLVAFLLSLW